MVGFNLEPESYSMTSKEEVEVVEAENQFLQHDSDGYGGGGVDARVMFFDGEETSLDFPYLNDHLKGDDDVGLVDSFDYYLHYREKIRPEFSYLSHPSPLEYDDDGEADGMDLVDDDNLEYFVMACQFLSRLR